MRLIRDKIRLCCEKLERDQIKTKISRRRKLTTDRLNTKMDKQQKKIDEAKIWFLKKTDTTLNLTQGIYKNLLSI